MNEEVHGADRARASAKDAARARALVAELRAGVPGSSEMYAAFRELDALPEAVVRAELAAWMGPLPDVDALDARTRAALRLPPRALRLVSIQADRDADILDLGSVAEEQVRLAGLRWDGADRPIEERLDGEIEGSFAGSLQRIVLADSEAPEGSAPLFDVVLHAPDTGLVFAAGTTQHVAFIADGRIETLDHRLRDALEGALVTRELASPAPAAAAPPKAKQKPAAKKASAKPAAARKTPSKAAPVKKATARKTAAKTKRRS